MNSKEYQATEWGHPNDKIRTSWGTVFYSDWLQLEAVRWKNKWREAWVAANSEGLVAMFTRADYILPVEPEDNQ